MSLGIDLATWACALWRPEILSDELHTEQVGGPFVITPQISYGLGVLIIRLEPDDPVEYAHNGALSGYVSWAGYRPDLDVSIALMANGWPDDGAGGYDWGYSSHVARDLWVVIEDALSD